MHARQMLTTHPHVVSGVDEAVIGCIEDCYDCAQACTACADACLFEPHVADLRQCIRLNQDCADICLTAGAGLTRRVGPDRSAIVAVLDACAQTCRICADECGRHAPHMAHCRICEEACRRCEGACREAVEALGARPH
jgi:hypothetical protein